VIDWLLVLSYAVILVSGLVISTWFNLELSDYLLWLDYHVYSSIAALAITMVKIHSSSPAGSQQSSYQHAEPPRIPPAYGSC
jgi:cytochrome b subunit of formate dehydrogenase